MKVLDAFLEMQIFLSRILKVPGHVSMIISLKESSYCDPTISVSLGDKINK